MASGIGEVRLYHNTANSIPVGVYDDITSQFTVGSTSDTGSLVKAGLSPGTQYWFWVEVIDVAGNESAILPLRSITTAGVPSTWIPALTAASDQGYTVTESSLLDVNYAGWYAFSRVGGSYKGGWSATIDTNPPQYVEIQMPAAVTANAVRVWVTQGYDTWKVLGCNIEGSNDGTNWTVLSTFTNMMYTTISAANKATNTLYQADFDSDRRASDGSYVFQGTITNPSSYSHYRLYVTQQENSRAFVDEIMLL